jgi:tetratricopeptide (TPR) repeat protein
MQIRTLKILIIVLFPVFSFAQYQQNKIKKADSLYKANQYTQSFTLYQSSLSQNYYSPAMLLKMAYIQEGLGHKGLCLYYLNLYQQATDDYQAITKMEELANKYRLEGYQSGEGPQIVQFFQKNNLKISIGLGAVIFFFFAWLIYQKRKGKSLVVASVFVIFFSALLVGLINWGDKPSQAIIASNASYIMSGPSAGASVVAIVEEGHRLTITGRKDVWLKVKWHDKDAFIKANSVLPIKI